MMKWLLKIFGSANRVIHPPRDEAVKPVRTVSRRSRDFAGIKHKKMRVAFERDLLQAPIPNHFDFLEEEIQTDWLVALEHIYKAGWLAAREAVDIPVTDIRGSIEREALFMQMQARAIAAETVVDHLELMLLQSSSVALKEIDSIQMNRKRSYGHE